MELNQKGKHFNNQDPRKRREGGGYMKLNETVTENFPSLEKDLDINIQEAIT